MDPTATILLAISIGLCSGFLDVGIIVFKKCCWNTEGHYRNARDFPWTVPLGHAALMVVPGVLLAALKRIWPVLISLRVESGLLATLAIWLALLRMPLYAVCSFLMAAGAGRLIGDAVAARGLVRRQVRWTFATLLGVLGVTVAISSGWQAVREWRTVAELPPSPPNARNVVLIVWDTVRAFNTNLYGYNRDTTPNLTKWARKGVLYKQALAPAPWTFPSHACLFTGQWPLRIDSQWKFTLDAPNPTLAEFLTKHGYQTAGFVANTNCCTFDTGLSRGFSHYADYALTPRSILTRTVAGTWILQNLLSLGSIPTPDSYYEKKWINIQSGSATEIDDRFTQWLGRRRPDRPFFAFLNYFDAHEPYIPPPGYEGRFGIRPTTVKDYQLLIDFVGMPKDPSQRNEIIMVRDCYDDCIAFLDQRLQSLLDALQGQGLLENTDVIITSDHGEAFGEHDLVGHSGSVNLEEVGVPLVILSPVAPAGRVVESPVSLRDLPATVVDLLGLSDVSPFPGRSLAADWKRPPGEAPPSMTSPAFSEQANATAFQIQPRHTRGHRGLEMSVVAFGHHYIRTGTGVERFYDLKTDPFERHNLISARSVGSELTFFRRMLLDVLKDNPGSSEVENAYLTTYRSWLEDLVHEHPNRSIARRTEH